MIAQTSDSDTRYQSKTLCIKCSIQQTVAAQNLQPEGSTSDFSSTKSENQKQIVSFSMTTDATIHKLITNHCAQNSTIMLDKSGTF